MPAGITIELVVGPSAATTHALAGAAIGDATATGNVEVLTPPATHALSGVAAAAATASGAATLIPGHLYEFGPAKIDLGIATTRQRRYEAALGYEGFLYYDRLADLAKRGEIICNMYAANSRAEFGAQSVPMMLSIDRRYLKGLILRPMLRQAPFMYGDELDPGWTLEDFQDAFETEGGEWSFDRDKKGLRWEATQLVARANESDEPSDWTTSVLSTSETGIPSGVCPDPFFSVYIRRAEPTQEIRVAAQAATPPQLVAPYTNIVWGDDRWMLSIPGAGRPKLFRELRAQPPEGFTYLWPVWTPVDWTEGMLEDVDAKRASEEGYTYHIGTIGGAVCVSESGFTDHDFAYYKVESGVEPVVAAGHITVTNWPGQCTLGLDLSTFPNGASAYRAPWWVGDYSPASVQQIVFGQPYSSLWVSDDIGALIGAGLDGVDDNSVRVALHSLTSSPEYVYYLLSMMRGQYPNAEWLLAHPEVTETLLTYTTPFAEAVTTYHDPTLTDNGVTEFVETGLFRRGMTVESALDTGRSQHLVARVSNEPAVVPASETVWHEYDQAAEGVVGLPPTHQLEPGRVVRMQAGRMYKVRDWAPGDPGEQFLEAVVDLGQYTVVSADRNRHLGQFDLADALGLAHLAKWTLGELNLRGWYTESALSFLLEMVGIGPAQYDLEDLGEAARILDTDDSASWDRGTKFAKILAEVADKHQHHAALWYDFYENKVRTGCRYCRAKRTGVVVGTDEYGNDILEWMNHENNGWLSSACLLGDYARVPGTGVDLYLVDDPVFADDPQSMYICREFTCSIASLDPEKFANEFVVVGKAQGSESGPTHKSFQDEIVARWRNLPSLKYAEETADQYLGFAVSHVDEDSTLSTRYEVNQNLAEAARWKGNWPRMAEVRMPMHVDFAATEGVRAGMVFVVQGAKYAACHGVKFRVTQVSLDFGSREQVITGREMAGVFTG